MDSLPTLMIAWGVLLGFLVLPGPNMVAVAAASLGAGRGHGVATAAGVATGSMLWALFTAYGLLVFLTHVPAAMVALKIAGGTYLIWLGIRAFRAAAASQAMRVQPAGRGSGWRAYFKGLGVIALNPKAFIGWVAISSVIVEAQTSPAIVLVFVVVAGLMSFLNYSGFAVLFSTRPAVAMYDRMARTIESIFGFLFCAFGVRILATLRG